MNVRLSLKGTRKNLSDVLIESLPEAWVNKYFPNLTKDFKGQHLAEFDATLTASGQGKKILTTLLVAAVLFAEDDQILAKLTSTSETPQPKFNVTDIELMNSYLLNGGKLQEVAHEIPIEPSILAKRLKSIGCPPLGKINQSTRNALKAFYAGAKLTEVLKMRGVNEQVFAAIIRSGSVNVRKALS